MHKLKIYEVKMARKCDSYSDSSTKMNHSVLDFPQPHLYLFLRNNIYYVRYELGRVDGKRRFKRLSLDTQNYFIAREHIMDMKKYIEKIYQRSRLYHQLRLEKIYTKNSDSSDDYDYIISKDNDIELLKSIKSLYDECNRDHLDKEFESYKQTTKNQIISNVLSKSTPEQIKDPEYI